MKLTETGQMLLDCLHGSPISDRQRLWIFLMLDSEDKILDMLTYMSQNRNATGEELMSAAERIAGPLR